MDGNGRDKQRLTMFELRCEAMMLSRITRVDLTLLWSMGQKGLPKDVQGFMDRVGIYRFFKPIGNEKKLVKQRQNLHGTCLV